MCRPDLEAAPHATTRDSLFFAFWFELFIGFWSARGAAHHGAMTIPGGGLDSKSRLQILVNTQSTVVLPKRAGRPMDRL